MTFPKRLYRVWCALPLVDDTGDLSITRCMAVFFAWMDFWSVANDAKHVITTNHVILAIAALAAAFGKSTFGFFLSKWQAQQSVTTTETVTVDERLPSKHDDERAGGEA